MLRLLYDRLIVQEIHERQTASGIYLPGAHFNPVYDPERDPENEFEDEIFPETVDIMPQLVTVLARGPEVRGPLEFEERVYISRDCGEYLWLDRSRYLVINEPDILYRPAAGRPYQPMHVGIRLEVPKGFTDSGIWVEMDSRLPNWKGEVVSLSTDIEADPEHYGLHVGDTAVFRRYSGREVPDPDDPYKAKLHVFNVADIRATLHVSRRAAHIDSEEREPVHA